jgi:thiosulfate reductase cytochrome b subunit
MNQRRERNRPAHPLAVRIMHWIGAAAVICMILSGWAIYNASPSLPFTFPCWMTLGGWLAGGIVWHISAMWVLFADGRGRPALRAVCPRQSIAHFAA